MKQFGIVVVEDDHAVNEGVVMILEKCGFLVQSFFTASAFNEAVTANVDLFLIDRQLDGLDGLNLCRRLKAEVATALIPIVIMSASPDARKYSQQAGADAFLEKPFSKKQLLAVIGQLIKY